MSWAKVGAKCICVDDRSGVYMTPKHIQTGVRVVRGEIYTIREVVCSSVHGGTLIKLEGVPDRSGFADEGYTIKRFRPLVTKTIEQDVQMFKRIAETAPSLEDAE